MIVFTGDDLSSIGRPRDGIHGRRVQPDACDEATAADIPQRNRFVIACRNDLRAVGREGNRVDPGSVRFESGQPFTAREVPNNHPSILIAGNQ